MSDGDGPEDAGVAALHNTHVQAGTRNFTLLHEISVYYGVSIISFPIFIQQKNSTQFGQKIFCIQYI